MVGKVVHWSWKSTVKQPNQTKRLHAVGQLIKWLLNSTVRTWPATEGKGFLMHFYTDIVLEDTVMHDMGRYILDIGLQNK